MKAESQRKGYAETVVTYDRNSQPKGSSNIAYQINKDEYKAVIDIGKRWAGYQKKKRADAAVERMAR